MTEGMPTQGKRDAAYHCGIGEILTAAYNREFTMLERASARPNSLLLMIGMQP